MTVIEKPYFYPVLIFLVGLGVYANSLSNGFTFDDWPLVVHNPLVAGLDLGAIFSSSYWAGHPEYGLYRPLTTWSYSVNRALLGSEAFGFHLVNVALHLVNAVLVFQFLRFVLDYHSAGVAALLFLLHPVQTEAVNSIVGRAELMACFWMLLGLITYARGQWGWTTIALLLGCLCKEHAVTLIGLVIAYDFWKEHRFTIKKVYLVFLLVAVVFLLMRYVVIDALLLPASPAFVDNPLAHISSWPRVLTAMSIMIHYGGLLLWPSALSADYSYYAVPVVTSVWDFSVGMALVLGAGCVLIAVLGIQKRISLVYTLAMAFALIPFLPVSNLLFPVGTIMAERLLYMPMVGEVMFCGMLFQVAQTRFRVLSVAVVVVALAACSVRGAIRNSDWKSNLTLFQSAVRAIPKSAKAHFNLGYALAETKNWQGALKAYSEAITIYPEYAEVHYNIGVLHQGQADRPKAMVAYRRTVAIDTAHVNAWLNMGVLMAQLGQREDAIGSFLHVLDLEHDRIDAHYNLALVYQEDKQWEAAIKHYQTVLDLDGAYADTAFNLGILLERQERFQEAVPVFLRAAELSGERSVLALLSAGRIYMRMGHKMEAKNTLELFLNLWKGNGSVRRHAENLLIQLAVD